MDISKTLRQYSSTERADVSKRFFKTGPGQYGEGDVFIGVTVPNCRAVAKQFRDAPFSDIESLITSKIHEDRLTALLILVEKYKRGNKKEIVSFYINNLQHVNNWDLVDLSADKLLGEYLFDKEKTYLYRLAQSRSLWERRIAVVSTFNFIKKRQFEPTFKIVEIIMQDEHDLIHKACGWMLREIGKRNEKYLETFLAMHYKKMPRTMLRYAIERFSSERRKRYLEGSI